MDLGEASRQYQATLEHERLTRTAAEGCVTFEDELDEASQETDRAFEELVRTWVTSR